VNIQRRALWRGGLAAGLAMLAGRNARASLLADVGDPAAAPRVPQSGYAPINGLRMYYEVHGTGGDTPLVLLHGGGSSIHSTFGRALPLLARTRKVIARDEQAHGRTNDRGTPERFETSADDVAALLAYLRIEKADLFGFSNGAGVAMQVAIRHPEKVRKLVFASYMISREGAYPILWQMIDTGTFANMPQPLKDEFLKVTPDPRALQLMYERDNERMRSWQGFDRKSVTGLQCPTLIVCGDQDVIKPEHAVELSRIIPHARLLIVPGNHGSYIGDVMTAAPGSEPEQVCDLITEFLDDTSKT
jgi:pimeloyl-ACP methyl ester carboxylesterase